MKALVTGASGFVGAAVARALLQTGWQVRCLLRPTSNRHNIQSLSVEVVLGDLTDADSLRRALPGCEAVFHVAADYRLGAPDPRELYRSNVEGTKNLLAALVGSDVKRMVYTSSVATVGIPSDGSPGREDTPVSLKDMIGHYKRSKFLAEVCVREAAQNGAPVVIVNPSTPVGPGDVKPTPTGALIRDAALGRMPAYIDTGLNIVHVDDVAQGHLLAYERGQVGERYILGGEDLTLQQILSEVARLAGRAPPRVKLPRAAVLPIAYVAEGVARLIGRPTRITVEGVRMAAKHMFFSSERARCELGYDARQARPALADAVTWLRLQGVLGAVPAGSAAGR